MRHLNGQETGNDNESFDNFIILLIHVYALAKIRQVKKKRLVEGMRATTPKVAMLADVIESHSAISSVYQCVTGPL